MSSKYFVYFCFQSKEEMALKIAQMIINDVNMQTQGLAGEDIPSPTAVKPPQGL